MDLSNTSSLFVPRLIFQTSDTCKHLLEPSINIDLETKNDVYFEISSWMTLLEAINQLDLPDDDASRGLVEEGQAHCSKYAVALSGIGQNLETVKTAWDSGMSYMAVQELQVLRMSLQTQREEMERWFADAKLALEAQGGGNADQVAEPDALHSSGTEWEQVRISDAQASGAEPQTAEAQPHVQPDAVQQQAEDHHEPIAAQQQPLSEISQETVLHKEPVSDAQMGTVLDQESPPQPVLPESKPSFDFEQEHVPPHGEPVETLPTTHSAQEAPADLTQQPEGGFQEAYTDAQRSVAGLDQEPAADFVQSANSQEPAIDTQDPQQLRDVQQPDIDTAKLIDHQATDPLQDSVFVDQSILALPENQVPDSRASAMDFLGPSAEQDPIPSISEQSPSHQQGSAMDYLQPTIEQKTPSVVPEPGHTLQDYHHIQITRKLQSICAGIEAVASQLYTLSPDLPSFELGQNKEALSKLVDQSRAELQAFGQDLHRLFATNEKNNTWSDPDLVIVDKATDTPTGDRVPIAGSHNGTLDGSETAQNDASTVWATPLWSPTQIQDEVNSQNVFDYLDQSNGHDGSRTPVEADFSREPIAPESAFSAVQTLETAPSETPGSNADKEPVPKVESPELAVSDIQVVDIKPTPKSETDFSSHAVHNGTQTIALPTPPPSLDLDNQKDKPGPKTRAQIGSDFASRAIIAKDTEHVSKVFSKIVSGALKKTSVSLGILEVEGRDWAAKFCEEHRYLNGILMAIPVPRDLFLWWSRNFPVDEDTWTRSALLRTVSMVTDSPRHLHSYPFRLARSIPADRPKLLLHWDLRGAGEPHLSARFKELVRAGGELQSRMTSFSYKQLVVCISIPYSMVQGQVAERLPSHQDKGLEFLEDVGILTSIPVDERVDGQIRERNWSPSSLKLDGSEQSITAYLQEVTFTGSPDLTPAMSPTPTRFVVVTVRKGEVDDWLNAVNCSLGMNSRGIRYPVITEEEIDFDHLRDYYRMAVNPRPSAKVGSTSCED